MQQATRGRAIPEENKSPPHTRPAPNLTHEKETDPTKKQGKRLGDKIEIDAERYMP
jgi:hypothetical protein